MSEHDVSSAWRELDDTLADGPCPADVPEGARQWLAEQRTMHGLLRAMHTADSSAREARVASVLVRIDQHTASSERRHWFAVAAAALLLATFGIWALSSNSVPVAEAAMARTADQLAMAVDRRFHVSLSRVGGNRPDRVVSDFDLVTRPGMQFLLSGKFAFAGLRLAGGRIGCDGETLWIEPDNGRKRRSGKLENRDRLLEGLGDILDLGYFDLHSLIAKLPTDYELRVVRRTVAEDGNEQLRIRANRRGQSGGFRLRSAELSVDNYSGMITRLDAQVRGMGGGLNRIVIKYLGVAQPEAVSYARPW